MEKVKKQFYNMPLQKYFVLSVISMVSIVVLLSGLTIWGCTAFCNYLLPESNTVHLSVHQTYSEEAVTNTFILNIGEEEQELPILIREDGITETPLETRYTIEKIENSFESLTPKRKLAYQFCQGAMIVVPAVLSITGVLICSFLFYKKKLAYPLQILSNATEQIASQNLDFVLDYDCNDEMGKLCQSFEQMRTALYDNYKVMWNMLEERRLLQASIAHDLRNPIAIIEGYTEYLQLNLNHKNLSEERIVKIITNLNMAAKRLEKYTESVRELNQMEDMEITRKAVSVSNLISDVAEDFHVMAEKYAISLQVENKIPEQMVSVDADILYRILENVFSNALRYAKETVRLEFSLENKMFVITITDDGEGFSDEILKRQGKLFLSKQAEDGHLGMGLAVSRILCKKHDGILEMYNNKFHNAVVKISLFL